MSEVCGDVAEKMPLTAAIRVRRLELVASIKEMEIACYSELEQAMAVRVTKTSVRDGSSDRFQRD